MWKNDSFSDIDGSSGISNAVELLFRICKFTLDAQNKLPAYQITSFISNCAQNEKQVFIENVRLFPITFPAKEKETLKFASSKLETTMKAATEKLQKLSKYESGGTKIVLLNELQQLRDVLCNMRDKIVEYIYHQPECEQ